MSTTADYCDGVSLGPPRFIEINQMLCEEYLGLGLPPNETDWDMVALCECYLYYGQEVDNSSAAPPSGLSPSPPVDISDTSKLVLTVLYYIVIIIASLGNVTVFMVFCLNKSFRSIGNAFLLSLAVSDFIMIVFCMPVNVRLINTGYWDLGGFSETGCKLIPYMQTFGVSANICTLIFIAIERFLVVLYPLKTKSYSQNQLLVISGVAIALIWVCASLIAIPNAIWFDYKSVSKFLGRVNLSQLEPNVSSLLGMDNLGSCRVQYEHIDAFKLYRLVLLVCLFLAPLTICSGLYVAVSRHLWSSKHFQNQNVTFEQLRMRTYKRVTAMLVVVQTLFIVCWAPTMIYEVVLAYGELETSETTLNLRYYFQWLAMCNSCVDPIVYVFMHHKFRKSVTCQGRRVVRMGRVAPAVDSQQAGGQPRSTDTTDERQQQTKTTQSSPTTVTKTTSPTADCHVDNKPLY